ncbi:fbox-lrr protein [Anaeramoeba flamelloides]|uniref:Fbox-lrr protein n=1 Tax=Anaeramoeba flamelloides TaxID=1746091 RepID=A0AAV8A1F6_9EUKA|nr:fbox-lrr protein [Anaeramoeba flamelloides]
MKYFSKSLKVNQTLINLDLSHNQIGDEGIEELSEALKVNQTLTNLDLSKTGIRAKGVLYLSQALKINRTLTVLDLSCNRMYYYENTEDQETNIQEFIQSLKINKSIIKLNIDGNEINRKDLNKIDNLIKRNSQFSKKVNQISPRRRFAIIPRINSN